MSNTKDVIKHLNVLLKNELTAINQYFLHSRMLDDWGVKKLAAKEYEESIDEMKHADMLIQRILFLEGLPNLQDLGKLYIGENVKEIIACDLKIEAIAHKDLQAAQEVCVAANDHVSRMLVEEILKSEEEHADWLQQQERLIEQVGIENYIQSQI